MLQDRLDRIQDAFSQAQGNDWITAVVAGGIVFIFLLFVFKILGMFLRTFTLTIALIVSAVVAVIVLDQRGLPNDLAGDQINRWLNDLRDRINL